MSYDFNHVQYPYYENPKKIEEHQEPHNVGYISNVKDEEHPLFSPSGVKALINAGRGFGNSHSEKELQGNIPIKLIEDVIKTSKELRIPIEILYSAMDWVKDLDQRKDGQDAKEIGNKLKNYVPELRKLLGKDPMFSEIFAAFVLEGAGKVKDLIEKAEKEPEKKVDPPGTKKDDILTQKSKNAKPELRTNRELFDYFYRRISNGKQSFLQYMSGNNG